MEDNYVLVNMKTGAIRRYPGAKGPSKAAIVYSMRQAIHYARKLRETGLVIKAVPVSEFTNKESVKCT